MYQKFVNIYNYQVPKLLMLRNLNIDGHNTMKSYHSLERLPADTRVKALVTYSAIPDCTAHMM